MLMRGTDKNKCLYLFVIGFNLGLGLRRYKDFKTRTNKLCSFGRK
jgi:hypothetical protein